MSSRANFADICLRGMCDRSMRSGTELAREIQLADWSTAGKLSNRSSGVQKPSDSGTRFGRYLYSKKCSWMIKGDIALLLPFLFRTFNIHSLGPGLFFCAANKRKSRTK